MKTLRERRDAAKDRKWQENEAYLSAKCGRVLDNTAEEKQRIEASQRLTRKLARVDATLAVPVINKLFEAFEAADTDSSTRGHARHTLENIAVTSKKQRCLRITERFMASTEPEGDQTLSREAGYALAHIQEKKPRVHQQALIRAQSQVR